MDYKALAQRILDLVGGPDNVGSFTNCMTRLRLNLVTPQSADVEAIKGLDGVLGVVEGKQLQVVVGPGHAERLRAAFGEVLGKSGTASVVDEKATVEDTATATGSSVPRHAASGGVEPLPEGDADLAKRTRDKVRDKQTSPVQAMFRHIGNIFVPVMPSPTMDGSWCSPDWEESSSPPSTSLSATTLPRNSVAARSSVSSPVACPTCPPSQVLRRPTRPQQSR